MTLKELLENMLTLRGQVRKLSDAVRGRMRPGGSDSIEA